IHGTNKQVFTTLQKAISDFMNNTVWTNHVFEMTERIECNMLINITDEPTSGSYSATLNIQSRRPIYASSYNTVMFNYVDNEFTFEYLEYDPLEFSENTYISNLTSILAYYAYIIIGLDYDSFSMEGGTPYFEKAEKIVNNAQSSGKSGWRASDARGRDNRYWLINNILDQDYKPLRTFNYQYHRLGLDMMDKSIEGARMTIKEAIIDLEKFYNSKPDPFMHFFQVLLESKATEITDIFADASMEDKRRIFNVMVKIDPANVSKYEPLK
ncbi:MAG: DUF4835 family protein, partial [Bacteroidales bacterium]